MKRALLLRLFDAFNIQRWNDKIRPVVLTEMDKNAHKMVIAYCLARYEEASGKQVQWNNLIRGGVFELLRRIVLSDIKSPVYRRVKDKHRDIFARLNVWVGAQLSPCIDDASLRAELMAFLADNAAIDQLSMNILAAAHVYASFWEFQIIKHANPNGYQIGQIDRLMQNDLEQYLELAGMRKIVTKAPIASFVDLVGQMRFQVRWSHTPRIPATSVLGHSMMVATISYLLTRELKGCDRRLRNNFFGGLFHDLPEAVTRDIISPVKRATGEFSDLIGKIEREMVTTEIYPFLEPAWIEEFDYFTQDEFTTKIIRDGNVVKTTSDDVNKEYNADEFNPIDGEITKVADHLAAFVEAYTAVESGIRTRQIEEGKYSLMKDYRGTIIGGIDVGAIYADF